MRFRCKYKYFIASISSDISSWDFFYRHQTREGINPSSSDRRRHSYVSYSWSTSKIIISFRTLLRKKRVRAILLYTFPLLLAQYSSSLFLSLSLSQSTFFWSNDACAAVRIARSARETCATPLLLRMCVSVCVRAYPCSARSPTLCRVCVRARERARARRGGFVWESARVRVYAAVRAWAFHTWLQRESYERLSKRRKTIATARKSASDAENPVGERTDLSRGAHGVQPRRIDLFCRHGLRGEHGRLVDRGAERALSWQ